MDANISNSELKKEITSLRAQLEESKYQLEEANDIINAIRNGEVDALVVNGNEGHQLYSLKSVDQTYRIFIEQMTEGAITLSRGGNILYCNSQFATLVHFPLEKIIGQPFFTFIADTSRQDCYKLIADAWEDRMKGELNLLSSDGQEIPVLLSLKTLNHDEGVSLSVIVTDLTGQKHAHRLLQLKNIQLEEAQRETQHLNSSLEDTVKERTKELELNIQQKTLVEEELRSNQEQLARVLETMAEGVGIIDREGVSIYSNPMAKKILGLNNDEKGRAYYSPEWKYFRSDGSIMPKHEHPIMTAIATGKAVYDYELGIEQPGRERFYISINAAPIYNDKGEIVSGIGTFMDVTNRRKAIQQKDEFISVASHELKTPITSLKASLQLLSKMKDKPSAEKLPELIEQANKSLNKVSTLVSALLNGSKITEGQLQLNKREFVLAELVNECCSYVKAAGVHFIIPGGDLDLKVYADPDRIEQVIVNFVNNAAKYSPDSKDIRVQIEKIGNSAKVSVTDEGPGIPQDKLDHLFDRYYRVDSNGSQYSGLGLGLYISSEIIKKHDGTIGVNSTMGKGSTFWFTIPLE